MAYFEPLYGIFGINLCINLLYEFHSTAQLPHKFHTNHTQLPHKSHTNHTQLPHKKNWSPNTECSQTSPHRFIPTNDSKWLPPSRFVKTRTSWWTRKWFFAKMPKSKQSLTRSRSKSTNSCILEPSWKKWRRHIPPWLKSYRLTEGTTLRRELRECSK